MGEPRAGAKAAARAATRRALLDAATELLFERPPPDPVAALRVMDVVRRADPPRTNGAFYNIWPTQEEFRRDVVHHVLSPDRIEVHQRTLDAATHLAGTGEATTLADAVRRLADVNFAGMDEDPALRLKHVLWGRGAVDPEVRRLLAGLYTGAGAGILPVYEHTLAHVGRRVRAPFTIEHLVTAVMALAEGLHQRRSVQSDAVPDDLGAPPTDEADAGAAWSLFATATYLLVDGMTEPAPG